MTAQAENTTALSTGEIEKRLYRKYHGDDFAICFEVRNDAGFHADRSIDALGIGLWPSRGCHLYGFEIKASRADWLKELKNAKKAEAFFPYCDYWFIVAGSRDIVRHDELPEGWGLIIPRGDGLEIAVAGKRRESAAPMPRGMLAAFVKRASMQSPNKEIIHDAYERGKKEGFESGKRAGERNYKAEDYQRLRGAVDRFQKETGIDIDAAYEIPQLVAALALARATRKPWSVDDLTRSATMVANLAEQMRKVATTVNDAYAKLQKEVAA